MEEYMDCRRSPRTTRSLSKVRQLLAVASVLAASIASADDSKMSFWSQPRKGANLFNNVESRERLASAREAGIEFVRLAPNKWLNGRPENEAGNFLLGPKTGFESLNEEDVKLLISILDDAHAEDVKVVLTMLSLPGSRWRQHNDGVQENALWQDFQWHQQAAEFWRQLASQLKDHPAIVGYNILNEPAPEKVPPRLSDWVTGDYPAWQETVRGTPADLNLFNRTVLEAIRSVDPDTPILLESGFYATPAAFSVLEPVDDPNVLYCFHMYEPFAFTNHRNDGKYEYPGPVPLGESENAEVIEFDREALTRLLQPVVDWQQRHGVPGNRIVASEFGVFRQNSGAAEYLRDVLAILDENHWHWALYAWREDSWQGMDYELGTGRPNAAYWQALEDGTLPGPEAYMDDSLFKVIRAHLSP